jgi:hypothetical protein
MKPQKPTLPVLPCRPARPTLVGSGQTTFTLLSEDRACASSLWSQHAAFLFWG